MSDSEKIIQMLEELLARTKAEQVAEPYTTEEFGKAIGRSAKWVCAKCAARIIKTLPGGKPYRIPRSEAARFNLLKAS